MDHIADEIMWPTTYKNWGAMLLPKILARWREISQLENRFVSGFHGGPALWSDFVYGWSKTPLSCCLAMGLDDESTFLEIAVMTPEKAFTWLSNFLKKYNASQSQS